MKRPSRLTDSALLWNMADAEAAIAARPAGAKVPQYWQEIVDCRNELARRAAIRTHRHKLREAPADALSRPRIRHSCEGITLEDCARTRHRAPLWRIQEARDAAYCLAFLTHCKN